MLLMSQFIACRRAICCVTRLDDIMRMRVMLLQLFLFLCHAIRQRKVFFAALLAIFASTYGATPC